MSTPNSIIEKYHGTIVQAMLSHDYQVSQDKSNTSLFCRSCGALIRDGHDFASYQTWLNEQYEGDD